MFIVCFIEEHLLPWEMKLQLSLFVIPCITCNTKLKQWYSENSVLISLSNIY